MPDPPPLYNCGEVLDPANLPPNYCKYEYDTVQMRWVLKDANPQSNYHCQPPNAPPGSGGTHIVYLYPCPNVPPPDPENEEP